MNYKLIIIFVVTLFIIFFVYREFYSFKDQFDRVTNFISGYKDENEKFSNQLQNNMIRYVSQIKSISNENLQQLRKITLLNGQHVKKMMNHFTEEDESANGHTENESIKKDKSNIYYMSDDDPSRNNNTSKKNIICEDGVCSLQNKTECTIPTYDENPDDDIPIYKNEEEDAKNSEMSSEKSSDYKNHENEIHTSISLEKSVKSNNASEKNNSPEIKSEKINEINQTIDITNPPSEHDSTKKDPPEKSNDNSSSERFEPATKKKSELVLSKLFPVKQYSYNELKTICKSLSLSVNHKDPVNGRLKVYKKDELYKNIKNHLINNNKI